MAGMSAPAGSGACRVALPLLALAGCLAVQGDTAILPIRDVELRELRPGATLRIRGAGFVPGPADIELAGTVAQPGESRRPWSFVVHASATSDEEIVGLVPAEAVDALHGTHGRFRGGMTVRFPPPPTPGLPPLVGRRDGLSCTMVSDVPASRETRADLEAAAGRFLTRLGLEVSVEAPEAPGAEPSLMVRSVPSPVTGPLAEIVPGDRIVSLDDVPVVSLADLAPDPAAEAVTLGLIEGGSSRPFSVHIALRGTVGGPPFDAALAVFAVLAVLGLVLYVHFAGLSDGLARLLVFPVVRKRPAPAVSSAAGQHSTVRRWRGQLLAGLALGIVAGAPILLYRIGRTWPVVWLWGASVGLLLVHRVAHAVGDLVRERAGPGAGLARSFGAVAAAGAAALPLTASVALVLWNSAALSVGGAVAAQGALPPAWAVLRDPFALLLGGLALARIGASFAPGQPGWRTALDVVTAASCCLLLALTGFGGWNVGAFDGTTFAGLPASAWALEGKAAVLFGVVAWYGRRRWSRSVDPRRPGLGWIAALPLALASVGLELLVPPEWIAVVVRPVTVGLFATLGLALWLGNRQRTAPAVLAIRVDSE
jgi:hypothetical protein